MPREMEDVYKEPMSNKTADWVTFSIFLLTKESHTHTHTHTHTQSNYIYIYIYIEWGADAPFLRMLSAQFSPIIPF